MSWLFGKKKHHKDSPPDSTEEEQLPEQEDGFVTVEPRPAPQPPSLPSSGLYPYIGQVPPYRTSPNDLPKGNNQDETTHYLSGVPFKLCKRLEHSMNSDLEIDRLRISEILSFIERIEQQNYEYEFTLEQGVIAEMNSSQD